MHKSQSVNAEITLFCRTSDNFALYEMRASKLEAARYFAGILFM